MKHSHSVLNVVESGSWALESMQLKESGSYKRLESRIQVPLSKNPDPVPGIWNPQRGIQNPRLSWIPLHEGIVKTLTQSMSLLNCSKHAKIMAMKRIYVRVFISCSSYCRYVEKEQLSLNSPEPNNYPGSSVLSPFTTRPWSVIQHGSSYPPKQRHANHDVSAVKLLNEPVLSGQLRKTLKSLPLIIVKLTFPEF